MPRIFIGIDMGTSACRACALDADGRWLASARANLPAPIRRDNQIEQDCGIWWQALLACMKDLKAATPPGAIATIAIDGTSGTLGLFDGTGEPLGPALMYNDQRALDEADIIARHAPRESGAHGASSSLAKLLWFCTQPEAENARYALHQADWLSAKLCGRFDFSDENNALKLGYDPVGRRWPDWMQQLPMDTRLLPEVLEPGSQRGNLLPELAEAWGLSTDSQVVAGTTDSTAAVIASGAKNVGDAVTCLGSTLVFKVVSDRPVFSPEYGVYSHRLGNRWLVGGASSSGGAVLATHFNPEQLASLSAVIKPNLPTGLDYYPLNQRGERFPVNDPALPPRLEPRPDDDSIFLQGLLEGMANIEYQAYVRLTELGAGPIRRILTIGGGTANDSWRRIRERTLEAPVITITELEPACGTAHIAMGDFGAVS